MRTSGSALSVIAAIREEAAAEVDRIEHATAAETAAIERDTAAASVAIPDREPRLAAERRAAEERVAQQEWQGRRAILERREQWMTRVVAAAHERWHGGSRQERVARLTALAREAVDRVGGTESRLTIATRERDLITDASYTDTITGGCIATCGDVAFDNSLEARERRFEPEWRNALAAMFRLEATS